MLGKIAIVSLLSVTTFVPARAVTLFTTGAPGATLGPGAFVDGWVSAEFFNLAAPATPTSITFYSFEQPGLWDGTLDYFLFNDVGSAPDVAPFAQGHNPAYTKTLIGSSFGANEYQYTFDIDSPLLAAGTYWLGIHLQSDFNVSGNILLWDCIADNPNSGLGAASRNGTFDNWVLGEGVLAFQVDAAPEPGTIVLAGLGVVLVLARRRR